MDSLQLPESLRQQLAAFEARLRALETLVAVAGALIGILGGYLLLFLSDRCWDTPWPMRLLLFAVAILGCGWAARTWLRRWVWQRRDTRELARLVQRRHRQLGDRLLGIVELTENGANHQVSPALVQAAIRQVATETAKLDFRQAAPTRRPRLLAGALIPLALLLALLLGLFPDAGLNAWRRLVRPWSDVPRYTFVSLDDLPARLVVAHGEPFDLAVGLRADSRWRPARATARCGAQAPLQARVEAGLARFRIPGQTVELPLMLSLGDARRSILVSPLPRPSLREFSAELHLPDYLQRSPSVQRLDSGEFQPLLGSRLVFRGQTDRVLASVAATGPGLSAAPGIAGAVFRSAPVLAEAPADYSFTWVDRFGLAAAKPWRLRLLPVADQAPRIACPESPRTLAILQEESVEIKIAADDDYGLRQAAVHWEANPAQPDAASLPERRSQALPGGGPEQTELRQTFIFSPTLLGIPQDTIVRFHAEVSDYYPERPPSRSDTLTIFVLSRAEHAKLLMQRLEQLQAHMEDLARREEALLAGKEQLHAQDDPALDSRDSGERLHEQELGEQANARDLERQRQDLEQLVREAMRNKDFPADVLARWAQTMQALDGMASQDLPQMQRHLNQARAGQGQQRRQELEKAIARQKEVLKKLRDRLKDIDNSVNDMTARNFAMRLREIAKREQRVKTVLERILPEAVGARAEDLPEGLRQQLATAVAENRQAGVETGYVSSDLNAFFARTRIKKYDDVYQAMTQAKASEQLQALARILGDNQLLKGIAQSTRLAQQFEEWAAMLEKRDNQQSEGGNQGEMSPEDMALLMTLMRLVQGEEEVRFRTRHLDQNRPPEAAAYQERAQTLHQNQMLLREVLRQEVIARLSPRSPLAALLERAEKAMLDAAALLRQPETGPPAIAAETEVIELLLDSASESGKGGGAQFAMMLRQMMIGRSTGPAGGGSMAGGFTDQANAPVNGDARGGQETRESPERFAGRDPERIAPEFRDLLQAYFARLDSLKN